MVSLSIVSLKVTEPVDDIKWGLTYTSLTEVGHVVLLLYAKKEVQRGGGEGDGVRQLGGHKGYRDMDGFLKAGGD